MNRLEQKPLLEHLADLRSCLVKSAVVLGVCMVGAFFYTAEILQVLYQPLRQAGHAPEEALRVLGVVDPFTIQMEVSFLGGLIIALPIVLFFIGQFILPALTPRERRRIWPVFVAGAVLFLVGVVFCYYLLLPRTLQFFWDYNTALGFRPDWTATGYIDFVVQMLLAFGLSFELPLVILLLHAFGIVSGAMLRRGRRAAIVIIVIAAACITPTSDLFSLAVLSVPMYALYEACVWIAWWKEKRA